MIDSTLNHLEFKTLKVKFYEEDIEKKNAYEAKYGYKTKLLCDMIETYDYNCTFANEAYVVYE